MLIDPQSAVRRRLVTKFVSPTTTCSSIPVAIVPVFDPELAGFVCFFVSGDTDRAERGA
jgi:hypothetical protein